MWKCTWRTSNKSRKISALSGVFCTATYIGHSRCCRKPSGKHVQTFLGVIVLLNTCWAYIWSDVVTLNVHPVGVSRSAVHAHLSHMSPTCGRDASMNGLPTHAFQPRVSVAHSCSHLSRVSGTCGRDARASARLIPG